MSRPLLLDYLCVALGGAIGSVARFWLSGLASTPGNFPLGTLLVNVTGSFVIGFFGGLTGPEGRWAVAPAFRTFVMVGICGGYTTFSAFSLQTLQLLQSRQWGHAGWNVLGSVALCLAAVWLGAFLAGSLHHRQ